MEKILFFHEYIVAVGLLVLSLSCINRSITYSRADLAYKENTIESLRAAARLDPGNAPIRVALAVQMEFAGQDPVPELRAAARLDPLLSEPWLRLGLLADLQGDVTNAERLLLHAAAIDHRLYPRSTLMSFYARRNQPAAFWRWARLAFERAYGDSSPLFDLCWNMAAEPAEVYEKAMPRNHDILRSYLEYLVSRGRLPAAAQPARDLLAIATDGDRDPILTYCDRLVDHSPAEALAVWNEACRRRVLPYGPLDPERLAAIVNPTFETPPLQRAFDWILPGVPQVSSARIPGGGIEFSFSGRQPEALDIMSQTFPVAAGRGYRLIVDCQTERFTNPTGLLVTALDRKGGSQLGAVTLLASEAGGRQSFGFSSPASGLVTLRFRYQRPLGSVRAEGTLIVRSVRLEAAP